ncbi:MAG TPA: DUF302 domain-containing protein [Dermatophilaceae bacterium]|nr:DUF302 domain-containing protein [Dermatophilaceae bacterium]
MGYALTTVVDRPFEETLAATRKALAEHGFGVLTEIDLGATLKKKLDVDIPPQIILGACNPPSAYQALQAEASIGLLLPCNVVVRYDDEARTIVEAIDPQTMHLLTGNDAMALVAQRVGSLLSETLKQLSS